MPYGNIARHPSYHNRYRSFGNEDGHNNGHEKREIVRSISEMVASEDNEPSSPRSPDCLVGAKAKRTRFTETRRSSKSQSDRAVNQSTDSAPDDVFVDMKDQGVITDPSDIIKMVEKRHLKATLSNSSTMTILPNPYNKINHRIHSFFWCTCCLYFVFICCLPGVHYMQESDEAFKQGDEKKAQRLGKMATLMFIAGALFSVACYAAILFLVIFFTAYH